MEAQDKRNIEIVKIILSRVRNNMEVLFDFDLTDKEFKESYKATKKEITKVIF